MHRYAGLSGLWLAVMVWGLAPTATATGFNLVAGPSVTSSARSTAAVFASAYGAARPHGRVQIAPVASLGWVAARQTEVEHLHRQVWVAGAGLRLTTSRRWFASEQVAATSGRTDALSSEFEFITSFGWRHAHTIVMLRHVSNGRMLGGGMNLGETMLLAGLTF